VMPNLKPPVTTVAAGRAYRQRILDALPQGTTFEPLMTCYLCDGTDQAEIRAGVEERVFTAVKLYPAGATTHSEYGVTAIDKVARVLEVMQEFGMPLLIHGESTDPAVDVFDKEAILLDHTLKHLLKAFPALKVVLEHITTEQTTDYVWRTPVAGAPRRSHHSISFLTEMRCSREDCVRIITVCRF